ncbi:MAG: hypothetical protein ABH863_01510 [Candidatus Micrarchaeota archaeon]
MPPHDRKRYSFLSPGITKPEEEAELALTVARYPSGHKMSDVLDFINERYRNSSDESRRLLAGALKEISLSPKHSMRVTEIATRAIYDPNNTDADKLDLCTAIWRTVRHDEGIREADRTEMDRRAITFAIRNLGASSGKARPILKQVLIETSHRGRNAHFLGSILEKNKPHISRGVATYILANMAAHRTKGRRNLALRLAEKMGIKLPSNGQK